MTSLWTMAVLSTSSLIFVVAPAASAVVQSVAAEDPCVRTGGGSIVDGGANGSSRRQCKDSNGRGYTQKDYWRWHCRHHGPFDVQVHKVSYTDASYGEYINEHPISLPANLTSEQLQALTPLTYKRRTCLSNGNVLSTIVFAVDSSNRSLEELIATARARVEPPIPSITRLPSYEDGNAVVVQTPLWVWTTDPVTETATDGASLQVSVTSQLQDMSFTLTGSDYSEQWTCDETQIQVSGDGLSGKQYLRPNDYNACHLIIEHSSTGEPNNTFTLTATATWTFTYTINGSAPFPIPGTVVRTNNYEVDAVEILVIES